jgi:hypothetical protein
MIQVMNTLKTVFWEMKDCIFSHDAAGIGGLDGKKSADFDLEG